MAEQEQEFDAEIAGQKIRTKGYRLLDLLWFPIAVGVAWSSLTLYNHDTSAQVFRSSSNKAVIDAIKDSNSSTVKAIQELTAEQKKSTNAMRETACLLDPAMRNRQDGREFCKRLTRDER